MLGSIASALRNTLTKIVDTLLGVLEQEPEERIYSGVVPTAAGRSTCTGARRMHTRLSVRDLLFERAVPVEVHSALRR